jgi:glycosyltransferase involved in cell wall biosynthesis
LKGTLAIFLPYVGVLSESFIRRHVQDLAPGNVVIVTEREFGHWEAQCPKLVLNPPTLYRRVRARLWPRGEDPSRAEQRAVAAFLKQHRVEVILGEYLDHSCLWLPLANDLGIRLFAHGHGFDISARLRDDYWRTRYRALNASAGVIVPSNAARERLVGQGIQPEKLHVIPCGVDVPPAPRPHPSSANLRCLAVGRMVAKKGPLRLLEAFHQARRSVPELRLDYVGDGGLLESVKQYIAANALEAFVVLHGKQPPSVVHRLLDESHLFLQHSMTDSATGDEEGLPFAILEAMAHALPVVATAHAGIPEAVRHGETGFLVQEGDVEGMADRIVQLARSPETRSEFGGAGWKHVRDRFSWEREREALTTLLGLA